MRHAVPPAEARRARNHFLAAFTAEALEELVYYEAAGRPGEAALAVELPPLRFEEGHGLSGGGGAAKTQQKRTPRAVLAVNACTRCCGRLCELWEFRASGL